MLPIINRVHTSMPRRRFFQIMMATIGVIRVSWRSTCKGQAD